MLACRERSFLLYIYADMAKLQPTKPLLILLYGMPGSGKTFVSRQICSQLNAAHVQADRIRAELFEKPTYSNDENHIVNSLMTYMSGEFLSAGMSVVFDTNVMRLSQRRSLRNMALKLGAEPVLLWLQIDPDSAFQRATNRDRRKHDDKYAQEIDPATFRELLSGMQNPEMTERYVVLSGKHVFNMQKNAIMRHLMEKRLIQLDVHAVKTGRPGLINLIPNPGAGRVDMNRRNINIQ